MDQRQMHYGKPDSPKTTFWQSFGGKKVTAVSDSGRDKVESVLSMKPVTLSSVD